MNTSPTATQLGAMRAISGWYGNAREASSVGYIPLPEGLTPDVDDQVAVRVQGGCWLRGIVLGLGRTRITVGTFNTLGAPGRDLRVKTYTRDAVMLKTWPCTRCGAYIHPVHDDLVVDVDGARFCSDLCLYLHHAATRMLAGSGS